MNVTLLNKAIEQAVEVIDAMNEAGQVVSFEYTCAVQELERYEQMKRDAQLMQAEVGHV